MADSQSVGAMVPLTGDECGDSLAARPGVQDWFRALAFAALLIFSLGYCCGCVSAIFLVRGGASIGLCFDAREKSHDGPSKRNSTRNVRVQGLVTYAWRRANPRYQPLREHDWGSWSE
jgi:hypothetical protein